MVKHISLVHRPAGMTHEAFVDYWKNVHAELVKTKLPGLRKYVGNIPVHPPGSSAPLPGSGVQLTCDAVVELHFDDLAALQRAMASPEWLSAERKASSARLADLSRHQFVVAEEYVVPM
jgi:uncharacterized protein (TIGR02118 family)